MYYSQIRLKELFIKLSLLVLTSLGLLFGQSALAQSGSINFGFTGCIVPVNSSYCEIPARYNITDYQAKNTTGVPLIVRHVENDVLTLNSWNIAQGVGEYEPNYSKLIIPTQNGSTEGLPAHYVSSATTHKISASPRLIPGANTLQVTKMDGTVVATEVVNATCESGSTWVPAEMSQTNTGKSFMFEYAQGTCVALSPTGGTEEAVESIMVEDCVITLGNHSCHTTYKFDSYEDRLVGIAIENVDAYKPIRDMGIGLTQYAVYKSHGSDSALDYRNGTYTSTYKTDKNVPSLREPQGPTWGTNKIKLSSGGQPVGETTLRGTCASGLIWTTYITNDPTSPIFKSACMPRVSGSTYTAANSGMDAYQVVKTDHPSKDADFGSAYGYCAIGDRWQRRTETWNVVGGTTASQTGYDCMPNVDAIDATDVKISISPKRSDVEDGSSSDCKAARAIGSVTATCEGALLIDAPTNRTYTLHLTSTGTVWTTGGFLGNLTEYSHAKKEYVMNASGIGNYNQRGGSRNTWSYAEPIVHLYYDKPVTYELRLPSFFANYQQPTTGTVVARITATPKIVKTGPCGRFQSGNCNFYDWTYSVDEIPKDGIPTTSTNSTPVTGTGSTGITTNPNTPVVTTPLPPGCASTLANSAYALANCQGATPTQPVTTTPVQSSNYLSSTLKAGNQSAEVETLQKFLVSQNYLASDLVTGYYGPATVDAVQKFQCAKNIVCDGTPDTTGYGAVGPSTRAAINAGNTTTATTQSNSDITALIQSLLAQVQALMVQVEALKARGL